MKNENTTTVMFRAATEIRELKLERDSLQRKVEVAEVANRYALATFRALDQYTFQDSDHGLLISEAVKKLEDDPLKEMECE